MDIGSHSRRARAHGQLLLNSLDHEAPSFRQTLAASGAKAAIEALGFTVEVTAADHEGEGCSVAGSCDPASGSMTVVCASTPRMKYTALHELGHLLGDDHDDFQDALAEAEALGTRAVEEDACEAFAAALLLPDRFVDSALEAHGRTAAGLHALTIRADASKEACAVAVAQRLAAPGYVVLLDGDGMVRFAARSGDVLPIARRSDQREGVLQGLLNGRVMLREFAALRYRSGASTDDMFVDAVLRGGVGFVVATVGQPDWDVRFTARRLPANERPATTWCEECGLEFSGGRRCPDCGNPVHDMCGRCACEAPRVRGERPCARCFLTKPASCFPDGGQVCEDCG